MHSKRKLNEKYSWVEPYLPLLYGQAAHEVNAGHHGEDLMKTDERKMTYSNMTHIMTHIFVLLIRFRNLNMTQFYIDTIPDIYLPFCEYHR